MMRLNELITQIINAEDIDELIKLKADLIKLQASLATQYAAALTEHAQALSNIKETYFEMSVTEARKKAGEQTGYRYKEIPEQIEAVKEAISLVDDKILSYREVDR